MLASQATALHARGQATQAALAPAVIAIDGQSYAAGTSGLKNQRSLELGGWINRAVVAFWLPATAFSDAGKPLPTAHSLPVRWNGTDYLLDAVRENSGQIILTCLGAEE